MEGQDCPTSSCQLQAQVVPFRVQEYAGELSETPKDAEKSAAQQALKAPGPTKGMVNR